MCNFVDNDLHKTLELEGISVCVSWQQTKVEIDLAMSSTDARDKSAPTSISQITCIGFICVWYIEVEIWVTSKNLVSSGDNYLTTCKSWIIPNHIFSSWHDSDEISVELDSNLNSLFNIGSEKSVYCWYRQIVQEWNIISNFELTSCNSLHVSLVFFHINFFDFLLNVVGDLIMVTFVL